MELLTGPDKGKQGYINYIVQVIIIICVKKCIYPNRGAGEKLGNS